MKNKFNSSIIMLMFMACSTAEAVIVAGANGGANNSNNTTRTQLESLPGVSDGYFFDNVFRMGAGNAVYIGYNNSGASPVGYALSGMHLGAQSTLNIQGTIYDVESRTSIGGSDLALFSFSHSSDMMPTLQALTLASLSPTSGTDIIMIGEGSGRVQNATTDANTSDAVAVTDGTGYTTTTRETRWGTNQTENHPPPTPAALRTYNIGGRNTVATLSIFDEPSNGEWLTTTEAQAVTNDSGGGMFTYDGTLTGIMVAVTATNAAQAAFGNGTLYADIATYKPSVDLMTGVLIPEPTPWMMVAGSLGLFMLIQRIRRPRTPCGATSRD